ncbi:GntR family transcriptional regulator [Bordetella genomosp. 2]|uniref:GntR family transcriptional regulator n=1 Tax=Bordetella genomosp. 2 TaxID=1983456 RepID=A0A261VT35_9BORD|nr:GntR family transcriptional regulator [Bordetella genomosp. 2]OZI76423.1 GntR family transcriptional regulator [Bordetella genomosp. 2]
MKRAVEVPAYRTLTEQLRQQIYGGSFAPGTRLPTEVELCRQYEVSRHTIRLALKQLVAEGLIDQIQGSGTYVRGRPQTDERYVRSIGSMDDLTMWPGTDMDVVQPFAVRVDASVASRLQLDYVEVATAQVRRLFNGQPFVYTRHHVSPALGRILKEQDIPSNGPGTVIGAAEAYLQRPVAGVQQNITALNCDADIARHIGCAPGDAVIFIERLYYDTSGAFIELTESFFNPRRYAYRVDLKRKGRGG